MKKRGKRAIERLLYAQTWSFGLQRAADKSMLGVSCLLCASISYAFATTTHGPLRSVIDLSASKDLALSRNRGCYS